MSQGNILQLVARGEEDVLLSSKPEFNMFKSVYKKFVPFADEIVKLPFNESSSEFTNRRISCTIPKRADLLSDCYLYVELPTLTIPSGSTKVYWTNSLGYALIKEIYIEIGGYKIDKHYGEWLYVWNQLTTNVDPSLDDYTIGRYSTNTSLERNAQNHVHLNVPLYFWFCRSPALALPLVALQYHEVKLTIELRDFSECVCYDGNTPPDRIDFEEIYLLSRFVYLDESIRKQFVSSDHVYLIEQLSRSNYETVKANTDKVNFDLTLNHPVNEIFWMFRETESEENNDWFNFNERAPLISSVHINPLASYFSLLFDGKEKIPDHTHENYFREIEKMKYHRNMSSDFCYVFSFATDPENPLQPSGACNFSRISNVQLQCVMNSSHISIPESTFMLFAKNYNYLVIKKGMCNLYYKI